MAKRRVFISYHHKGEQKVVDEFIETFTEDYEVFTDSSLSDAADSEEPGDYKNLLDKFSNAGITVSVIGLGSDRDADAAFSARQDARLSGAYRAIHGEGVVAQSGSKRAGSIATCMGSFACDFGHY